MSIEIIILPKGNQQYSCFIKVLHGTWNEYIEMVHSAVDNEWAHGQGGNQNLGMELP